MHEQLHHLIRLMDHRDHLTVQVLRSGTYGNPARGGGLTVFGFGDRGTSVGFANVVFGPSTYYHDETDTATMFGGFVRIRDLALSPSESRRLINEIAEGH